MEKYTAWLGVSEPRRWQRRCARVLGVDVVVVTDI